MSRHAGPRPESAAHKVMCRLVDLGGKATTPQLLAVLGAEYHSVVRFNSQVTDQVILYSLATVVDGHFTATLKGKNMVALHAGRHLPPAAKYVGKVATARVAPKERPLNVGKHFTQSIIRDGALDYRSIPSLMGNQRVLPNGEVVE